MDTAATYIDILSEALNAKIQRLNALEMKQLKDGFKLFQSAFQAGYTVLIKKAILHEDPYKYELKISDLMLPPETAFSENEKMDQMSIRLSQFDLYLDFLNTYYEFSVEFLSLGRIKRLMQFAKYFDFTRFSANHESINTRSFAEIVEQSRKGLEPLSAGILNESLVQLDKASRTIFKLLKDLMFVQRERYKLEIRAAMAREAKIAAAYTGGNQDEALKMLRRRLGENPAIKTFHPDLALEVFQEDFAPDGARHKESILESLRAADSAVKTVQTAQNIKILLLEGCRILITIGFQLDDAAKKLEANEAALEETDKSLLTKIKRALKTMFGAKSDHTVYDIEVFDPAANVHKTETLDFTVFKALVVKRSGSLVSMTSKTSAAYKKLEQADEDAVYAFLAKAIQDLQSMHRKMTGLDDFFQLSAREPELKGKIRSIKTELGSIKNAVLKANQKRHEYIALKDEIAQMKRLGIQTM